VTPYRLPAFDPSDEVCGPLREAWAVVTCLVCMVGLAMAYVVCLAALMRDRQERLIPAPAGVRIVRARRRRYTPPARHSGTMGRGTVSP
jgi:hypothetical protein